MIRATGESTALAVRGFEENHRMPGGRRRKGAAERVAIPTRHDGKRHRRLAKLERGAEVFAAWCLILAVAARCPRPGVLVDEQGEAIGAEDLSDMTGFPAEVFELGIAALLDERIGWLVRVPLCSAEGAAQDAGGVRGSSEPGLSAEVQARGPGAGIRADQESDRARERPVSVADVGAEKRDLGANGPDRGAGGNADDDALSPLAGPDLALRESRSKGREPIEPSERERIDGVEEALFHMSLLGRVSPDLYRPKEVTRAVLFKLWSQAGADAGIRDIREAFVERLSKWGLGDAGGGDCQSPSADLAFSHCP